MKTSNSLNFFAFNRNRDNSKIAEQKAIWEGPYSLPSGYEQKNGLEVVPHINGMYLFCYEYKDSYLVHSAGLSKDIKRRMYGHITSFRNGTYTILDINEAKKGIREEIWHGWEYAKEHREQFKQNKEYISEYIEKQLIGTRLFVTELPDRKLQHRFEYAIMHNIYQSKEPWSEISDRGMYLRGRDNQDMPIKIHNVTPVKLYGLPSEIEI